jgi:cytochrome c oxidase subunit 2
MQEIAWYLTVIFVGAIGIVFIIVAVRSRQPADYSVVQPLAYRQRARLFWGLVIAGVAIAVVTLRGLPYVRPGDATPPQVVTAQGFQWYWELGRDSVVAGEPVEFQITSADVNHGFGIYDAEMHLVAQAQAMPGYVNRLRYTFTKPGKYRLLCLEYCGLAHHDMVTELEVLAPK